MLPGASSSVQPCASTDQSLHKFCGGAPSVPALRSSGALSVRLCLTLRPGQAVEKPPTHPPPTTTTFFLLFSLFSPARENTPPFPSLLVIVPPHPSPNIITQANHSREVSCRILGLLQTGGLLSGSERPPFIPPAWMWDYGRGEGGWGRRGELLL